MKNQKNPSHGTTKNNLKNVAHQGSDKQHPNTPSDANARFKKIEKKENIQNNPGKQNTG